MKNVIKKVRKDRIVQMATNTEISFVNICVCCNRKFKGNEGFLNIMFSTNDYTIVSKTYATCKECSLIIHNFIKKMKEK